LKVRVLGDERTVIAFRLAGIGGEVVSGKKAAADVIEKSKDVGIFLVMDDFFPSQYKKELPVLVRIPRRGEK
jgi:vacuolar-type H+-ATPase subunit F/Vma7